MWNDFVASPSTVLDAMSYVSTEADSKDGGSAKKAAAKKGSGAKKGAKEVKSSEGESDASAAAEAKSAVNSKQADLLKSLELKMNHKKRVLADKLGGGAANRCVHITGLILRV